MNVNCVTQLRQVGIPLTVTFTHVAREPADINGWGALSAPPPPHPPPQRLDAYSVNLQLNGLLQHFVVKARGGVRLPY